MPAQLCTGKDFHLSEIEIQSCLVARTWIRISSEFLPIQDSGIHAFYCVLKCPLFTWFLVILRLKTCCGRMVGETETWPPLLREQSVTFLKEALPDFTEVIF